MIRLLFGQNPIMTEATIITLAVLVAKILLVLLEKHRTKRRRRKARRAVPIVSGNFPQISGLPPTDRLRSVEDDGVAPHL